ncbi:MAG: response regulator [Thermodesulfovibrionales bacterium]|nr:response regulator [Thermodesulfovibrionales bacterium]MDP3110958.1 response regulator [Thermodesulfovibrionales bacterium]
MKADNKKILVADDDADVRKVLNIFLTYFGYEVDCVNDGEDAMILIEKSNYSLLITDYEMPRINGIELIKKVRNLSPSMPIIGISGLHSSRNEFLTAGASLFMEKPFTLSILKNALERELLLEISD